MLPLAATKNNLYISTDYINSFNGTLQYLKQFDVGLVFYIPQQGSMYIGENIYHIGLASGKFSQYMKVGLPTIAIDLPTYKELNNEYNFGFTVNDANELSEVLSKHIDYETLSNNAKRLFKEKLDPTLKLQNYIEDNLS